MSQFDYSTFQDLAQRLVSFWGGDRNITVKIRSEELSDPQRPYLGTENTFQAVTGPAVILDYQESDIDGDIIKRGDKRALFAAKDVPFELTEADEIEDTSRNEVWRVMQAEYLQPSTAGLLYTFQLRK